MSDNGSPGEGADAADDPLAGGGTGTDAGAASQAAGASSESALGAAAGTAKAALAPLVASKLRIFLLFLVATGGLLGGGFALGVLGAPAVNGVQNDFGNVTEDETTILTNVSVQNPNPIGLSLGGVTIDYQVSMNDVRVANGTKNGVSMGSGNSTMRLETTLYNDRIPPWFASHVRNDERTAVNIDATIDAYGFTRSISQQREIDTDILGSFSSTQDRPIDANQPLISDPVLVVEETDASWGTVSREETPIDMSFAMYNPNTQPIAISELRYNVTMNDVLVSQGATEDPFVIPGGTRNTLHATTAIQNQRLDEWWVSHLDESVYGHQVSQFRIDFTAVVELPTGETVVVPLDDLAYEDWITTDLFDEGGSVGVPPSEQSGDGSGSEGGNTSDDGTTDDGNTTDGSGGNDSDDGGFLG
ncbi:hypothetical protein L593_07645 [Salinarchaeum sp. Harcht-Bsk1]|uniref:LEA type 2 family protein n=1 Tax=Salinarchaeum sp. Harcht-Bsk1 TaxID=1333523 RepID=UPI00034232F7|nr:LEA type 2 family protein [Salinarchaeum sp. Harcht-Bsk1]AGN01474.1 hypothetical protein L593_07645 [Salinarchaeum sp. Harcht-Bsk1]